MTPKRLTEIGHYLENSPGSHPKHRKVALELHAALVDAIAPVDVPAAPVAEAIMEPPKPKAKRSRRGKA